MKAFSISQLKHAIVAIFLLLANFGSQECYASVMISTGPALPPPGIYIMLSATPGWACIIDEPCVPPDAAWTEFQLPNLQVGQQVSISSSSSNFAFSLGNSLNGKVGVSLTPFFRGVGATSDELTANIADRHSILSTTNASVNTFEANSGTDYYLLLSGLVRGNQTYQLQLSQVPVPAAFWLFGSGLAALLTLNKRKSFQL